jgi:hypothetical protein
MLGEEGRKETKNSNKGGRKDQGKGFERVWKREHKEYRGRKATKKYNKGCRDERKI